jgi:hypothetical protein
MGPLTGRGAGYCAGFQTTGIVNDGLAGGGGFGRGFGRGLGRGFGRGLGRGPGRGFRGGRGAGWRNQAAFPVAPVYPPTLEEELDSLQQQAVQLEQSLTNLNERIALLQSSREGKE